MKNVILFSTKTCPHCTTAKKFLSQNKIHYIEKDINTDAQARSLLMKRGITGVPSFLIGEDMVVGLDQSRILALVDHRVVACEKCGTNMRIPTDKGTIKATCPKCGNKFTVTPK